MALSSPIVVTSSDVDEDVQFISATTRVQREERAKAAVVPQQPLNHDKVAKDQRAAVAKVEKLRAKSADGLTQTKDCGLDMKRSSSVPQVSTAGTTKQCSKPSYVANRVIDLGYSENNDHQPRLGPSDKPSMAVRLTLDPTSITNITSGPQPQLGQQSSRPSTVNTSPPKRKNNVNDDSTRKRSKVASSTNTFSNAAGKKVIVYDVDNSSNASTASASSDDLRSDPTYHPDVDKPTKPVAKWIQMQRAGLPLKPHIFADLANQIQFSFDFAGFAEKYKMPVSDIFDVFSAVVLIPCLDFNENGRKTMPELWKKVKENQPAMERAIGTIDGPQKKKVTTGLLGKAVKNARVSGARGEGSSKKK